MNNVETIPKKEDPFLRELEDAQPEVFRPELISRRGELISWGFTTLVFLIWVFLWINGNSIHLAALFLAAFLMLTAIAISMGNWMDRQTILQIMPEGIEFKNGLRHARLSWDEIRKVQVFHSSIGKKVHVIGTNTHFNFRTLGEVKVRGQVKGRMGFPKGDYILGRILRHSSLNIKKVEQPGSSYYYARD